MTLQRWNHEKKIYEPYQVNPEWNVVLYTTNLSLEINCTTCGRPTTFGECYTSREVHNPFGLGYPVCELCYGQEGERLHAALKESHK